MKKGIMIEEQWGVLNLQGSFLRKKTEVCLSVDLIYKGNSYRSRQELTSENVKILQDFYYSWLLERVDAEDVDALYEKLKNAISLFIANQSTVLIAEKIRQLRESFGNRITKLCEETSFPKEAIWDFLSENEKDICINIRN